MTPDAIWYNFAWLGKFFIYFLPYFLFSILLFSIFIVSYWFVVCLLVCTVFIFVTEIFERPSGGDSPWLCRVIIVLALEIHYMCSVLKRLGGYVKTSFPRCFVVEYTWNVCKDIVCNSSFTQQTNLLLSLITYSPIDNTYSVFLFFSFTLYFHLNYF